MADTPLRQEGARAAHRDEPDGANDLRRSDRHNVVGISVVRKFCSARRHGPWSPRLAPMGLPALALLGAGRRLVP